MSDPIETWNLILTEAGLEAALAAKRGGFAVDITHMAAGDAAYEVETDASGRTAQTEMRNELQRVEISEAIERGNGQTSIAAVFDGPGDFYVREIGILLDDGTLYAVVSHPRQAMFWKSAISTGYVTVDLVLGAADPENVRVIAGGAPIQLITSDIREDLRGLHDEDGQFNFALTQGIEQHLWIAMEQFEQMAQIRRGYGQSGIKCLRHYRGGGDAAWHRPSAVSFAALGAHNHPNYPMMCGMPELNAVINGYEVTTRHIDYRIVHGLAGGGYLEVDDAVPPAVPPSVLAQRTAEGEIAEMAHYLRAFALKDDAIRDYADHFDTYLSVLEVWLEDLSGDALSDTFPSFRHRVSQESHRAMTDDYAAMLATGIKPRFENNDLKPTVVRVMRRDGRPQFATLRYRVTAVRLGTYRDWPAHLMTAPVDDPATRLRFGRNDAEIEQTRLGRFRVVHGLDDRSLAAREAPGLLDAIMARMPGLDGPQALIEESYSDTDNRGQPYSRDLLAFDGENRLNGGFYNRFYGVSGRGAAGRWQYRFGFNDPMLYRAATTRQEVTVLPGLGGGHRMSWAIPLELVVASPLGSFNPHDVAIRDDKPQGTGATRATALSHAARKRSFYLTPADLFEDGRAKDLADTDSPVWVRCGDGQGRRMRGSGIYLFTPPLANALAGGAPAARMRWPIAPVHHEGSFEFGHFEARRCETLEALAANAHEILKIKHTARYGGFNGA